VTTDLEPPARALAVGAHPDDIEFGCGGTLAKWARAGTEVQLLILTDGSKGTWDPNADLGALVATRRSEQDAAAAVLGVAGVQFLDGIDGELDTTPELRRAVCEVIRRVRPDVVLGHDPWKRYRLHPDHVHAGQLAIDGIVAARDPHFFAGLGTPHRPDRLLLFEAEVQDHVEDIAATLAVKAQALLEHRSQWRSTMGIEADGSDADEQRTAFVARLRDQAELDGAGAGLALGEAFKRVEPL
jgi:LmbE family N-acetylglucosaminyl deacetylase